MPALLGIVAVLMIVGSMLMFGVAKTVFHEIYAMLGMGFGFIVAALAAVVYQLTRIRAVLELPLVERERNERIAQAVERDLGCSCSQEAEGISQLVRDKKAHQAPQPSMTVTVAGSASSCGRHEELRASPQARFRPFGDSVKARTR